MTTEVASTVAAGCRAKSAELAGALERALAGKWQLADALVVCAAETTPRLAEGPGLLMQVDVSGQPVLLVLPDPSRLLPPWCAQPSQGHSHVLARLTQEMGLLLLSASIPLECCRAGWHENLAGDIPQEVIELSDRVVLQFVRESQPLSLWIYWPAPHTAAGFGSGSFASGSRRRGGIELLAATYSRSLLRIRVPVKVTLASKKQPISRIVELGPGAIIHFDKSCEEMLDLEVGGQTVAQGEPVKVGDKFGIRLTSLASPQERFLSLSASRLAARDDE